MMLHKRIMPCLLLHKGGLYKTEKFKKPTYIGDPINAIKIFNEKEVDELMFIDIDATVEKREPNYQMIDDIASECFMPLCYGGGVKTVEQMKKIYALGVEKISLSSVAFGNPQILTEAVETFGGQSVLVTLDIKKDFFGKYRIYSHNGTKNTKLIPLDFVKKIQELGVGEIVINSIENDGVMQGFDVELLKQIKGVTNVPIIALGGAGKKEHIKSAFANAGVDAVACGSFFVYQGPLRGVLISYVSYEEVMR